MDLLVHIYSALDAALIFFYRLPENPVLGYFLGTLVLSVVCMVIGQYSIALAFRMNRKRIESENHEMQYYHGLSITALKSGDKSAYRACNSIANDAYGKNFFAQIALAAASLWPVFIALGWMEYRFDGIEFSLPFLIPGADITFGYISTFLLCYITVRYFFTKIRLRPVFTKLFCRRQYADPHMESSPLQ